MSEIWVSLAGEGLIAAYNAHSGACEKRVNGFLRPGGLCAFGGCVYALDEGHGSLVCVNAATARRVWEQPAAPGPTAVIATPSGRVFVAGGDCDSVIALNCHDGRLLAAARVGGYPRSLDISADGERLLVCCALTSCLQLLCANTLEIIAECALPYPACCAMFGSSGGAAALVRGEGEKEQHGWLCKVNDGLQIVEGAHLPGTPLSLARFPSGDALLLSHVGGVTAFCEGFRPEWTVALEGMPDRAAFCTGGGYAYILNTVLEAVHVLNIGGRAVEATLPVGKEPNGIAFWA